MENKKHAGGRPRTTSLSSKDMIDLGKEMVEWVIENQPIHLSKWYTVHKDFTDSQWDAFRKCPEFIHYYTKALKIVGYQYIDKDSKVDVRIKDRWLRVYFKDLRDQEDDDSRYMSKLKAQEQNAASETDSKKLDALTNQISEALSLSIERKMDAKRSKADAKS